MKRATGILCFIFLLCLSGCATLFSGDNHKAISVTTSTGDKIDMTVSAGVSTQTIVTPAVVVVPRGRYDVVFTSDGDKCHERIEYVQRSRPSGWFFLNILGFPGGMLTSTTTDAISGKMWTYADTAIIPVAKKEDAPEICK